MQTWVTDARLEAMQPEFEDVVVERIRQEPEVSVRKWRRLYKVLKLHGIRLPKGIISEGTPRTRNPASFPGFGYGSLG